MGTPALCLPAVLLAVFGSALLTPLAAEPQEQSPAALVQAAAKAGSIAYRLTTPEELKKMLGEPKSERRARDGDMETLELNYPDVDAGFRRMPDPAVFTLFWVRVKGADVDIGRQRQVVLRTADDLKKLDGFLGGANVSLAKLDLRAHSDRLMALTFDSLTVWPERDKMPPDFEPARVLEDGKNPGLGIRALHQAGINGQGVGIAIIDQPLLQDHREYKDALVRYEAIDVDGVPPQMHGPPVASIAVGQTCGVAPKAALHYYAVPAWKWNVNEPWAATLDRIIALSQTLSNTPKIRVVSISLGAFSTRPNFDTWQAAVKKAEAAGILVVTCDPQFLHLATLRRLAGRSGEDAADYQRGRYSHPMPVLCAPAGNRTMASFRGQDVYTLDRTGGMSWAVPYLAGLAALGWQVEPSLNPAEIVPLWRATATKTDVGPVVNPAAFIAALKHRKAGAN